MKLTRKPVLYVALMAIVILAVGALYVNLTRSPASAAGCGMPGMDSDMSNCPMGNSGSDSSSATASNTSLRGSVLAINKSQHKVSIRIDLPYSNEASSALTKTKTGDQVTINVSFDKSGNPVVTGVTQSKGATVTLAITGIQCQACADRLQSSLRSVPGINGVTVTADPAQAVVTYDKAKISVNEIKDAIRSTEPIHEGMPFGVKD